MHNNEIVNINHTDRLSKYYHEARQLKKLWNYQQNSYELTYIYINIRKLGNNC